MSRFSGCWATSTATSIYLGERECFDFSRRNQKGDRGGPPSPLARCRNAQADGRNRRSRLAQGRVQYDSAGTVRVRRPARDRQLLLPRDETTPACRSKHPVTELITRAVDLVEATDPQRRGRASAVSSSRDVKLTGWAVESRVYARGSDARPSPAIGPDGLTRLSPTGPKGTHDGRHGAQRHRRYSEGGEISIHYDPMIAQARHPRGPNRLWRDRRAGDPAPRRPFVIDGIRHNIPFLSALMQHPRWAPRDGLSTGPSSPRNFTTDFIPSSPMARPSTVLGSWPPAADRPHAQPARKSAQYFRAKCATPSTCASSSSGWSRWARAVLKVEIEPRQVGRPRIVFADGRKVEVHSDWKPGGPFYGRAAPSDGRPTSLCRCAPILKRLCACPHAGVAVDARVYTRREA